MITLVELNLNFKMGLVIYYLEIHLVLIHNVRIVVFYIQYIVYSVYCIVSVISYSDHKCLSLYTQKGEDYPAPMRVYLLFLEMWRILSIGDARPFFLFN